MKGGGKNTKMETNAAGARTLVTTVGDKTYKLNISNITNGLKTNPNQMIFNTVSDDSSLTDTYLSAMGLAGKTLDLPALANTGILKKESRLVPVAGKSNEIYTVDRDEAYRVVAGLSENLVKDPASYNYTNSIWQDKLGKSITLKQALASEGEEKVLKQIREYYVEEAIGASIANGISVQLPKPEKDSYYKTDKQLQVLAKNPGNEITVFGKKYKIKTIDEKQYIIGQEKQFPPIRLDKDGKIISGSDIPTLDWAEGNKFPLYIVDEKTKKKTLNYDNFRAITGDTTKIKN